MTQAQFNKIQKEVNQMVKEFGLDEATCWNIVCASDAKFQAAMRFRQA
jgi:hypothetical protein